MTFAPSEPLANALRDGLPSALQTGEFWPAFQPLIHIASQKIAGFEVLARWRSAEHGHISPAVFIPLAEEAGLLHALSLRLIEEACTLARPWEGNFYLAFNLAPSQFLRPDLAGEIQAVVARTGFAFSRVRVEITENALFHDNAAARCTIDALKAAGASLSLDDFGTGHSSLTRLQSMPFDEIKIDASFVRALETDSSSLKIITSVLGLGQSLGVHVIAEGIETERQATVLSHLGCEYGQGYLWGRPEAHTQAHQTLLRLGAWTSGEHPLDTSPFQRLHQLETLYEESSMGLCFLDAKLRLVSANPKLGVILGREPSELLGLHLSDARLAGLVAPELLQALERVRDGEVLEAAEYRQPLTGSTFLITHRRVRNDLAELVGISLVMVDITSRVRAEKSIQDSEEHFRRAIELGPNIAWAAGPDGAVDYMGPAFEWTVLGSAQERYERWMARMNVEDRPRVRAQWLAHIPSGKPFKTEFRILWPDDTWRWVRSQAYPHIDEHGNVLRWYGLIMDISSERLLSDRILELERKLAAQLGQVPQEGA